MRSLIICSLATLVLLAGGPARLLGLEGRQGSQVDLLLRTGSHQELTGVN